MITTKVPIRAAGPIPRWSAVTASGELADSSNPAHEDHIIGVTDGAIAFTAAHPTYGDVTTGGALFNKDWTWTTGGPIYLNGTTLSQTPPGVGFVQQVGWAMNAQTMLVNVR